MSDRLEQMADGRAPGAGERLSLAGSEWVFTGFHGEDWRWRGAFRRDTAVKGWQPATVPGSVHWDLLKLGEIPDPYFEQNSRLVEWVHQRQWVYKRDFAVPAHWEGRRIFLQFDGVDYEAEFYLDGELLGAHDSMFVPVRFELTGRVRPGERHHLAVVLKDAPREWPQLGRTSEVRTAKARFGYWWDFATRLVHLGIWQDVFLYATGPARLEDVWVRTALTEDLKRAEVTVTTGLDGDGAIELEILDPAGAVVTRAQGGGAGADRTDGFTVTLTLEDPALWWPNGWGDQPLYRCRVRATADGAVSDQHEVTFGIRRFTLEPNPWPPPGAEPVGERPLPYTFTVNGQRLFIKGWNWVPVDHLYGRADLAERYEHLIRLARESGANLLRVWGGGLIERELFYDLCDRAGLLVWQEFIQSSSGTDNVPPSDPAYLALLEREAEGVIPLRRNHPSLAVWCGGNELTDRERRPATTKEPALALLACKVRELDPDRPFLPTSPSGPMFDCSDYGGLERPSEMHDVHGGWHYRGPVDSYLPYNHSTALFHSEFGAQGAVAKSSLDRFMSPERQWPPDESNPLWVHHGAWWMQRHRVRELFGEVERIEEYLPLSQYLQAELVRYGVESNRRRWPRCSGTIIWQLNEPWPNGHCTNAVDYYLRPKMAYYYVKKAYAPVAASLRYEGPILKGGTLRAVPFVVADRPWSGRLRIAVSDPTGRVWHQTEQDVTADGAAELAPIAWPVPKGCPDVIICTLTLLEGDRAVHTNPYLFSRAEAPIFESLRALPEVRLSARREGDRLVLRNEGEGCAFFPAIDIDDPRYHWWLEENFPMLAPGAEAAITIRLAPRLERAEPDYPHGRPAEGPLLVRVSGWNVTPLTLTWEVQAGA